VSATNSVAFSEATRNDVRDTPPSAAVPSSCGTSASGFARSAHGKPPKIQMVVRKNSWKTHAAPKVATMPAAERGATHA
jgi:hypothetical protein